MPGIGYLASRNSRGRYDIYWSENDTKYTLKYFASWAEMARLAMFWINNPDNLQIAIAKAKEKLERSNNAHQPNREVE